MSISVASWNAQNAFGDVERMPKAVDHALSLQGDVVMVPEAYEVHVPGHQDRVADAVSRFEREGYSVRHVPYNDPAWYDMEHGFMALSRIPATFETVRSGTRSSIGMIAMDETVKQSLQLVGLHLDHRYEQKRLMQLTDVFADIVLPNAPLVLLGDMNAFDGSLLRSRLLQSRFLHAAIDQLPRTIGKYYDSAASLAGMATGGVVEFLEAAGLSDADPAHHSTMPSRLPFVQLDHIFVSQEVEASDHRVHTHNPTSDHRAISATLSFKS